MSVYRKIHIRVWGDKRFRALSDDSKLLFFYLLTGPHTTSLPGLFEGGQMGLAEKLGWEIDKFKSAFTVLEEKKMVEVDWEAQIIFIPNQIKYNPPHNPNIVKGWAKVYDNIPESPLKSKFYAHVKRFLKPFGESFLQSFLESFANIVSVPVSVPVSVTEAVTVSKEPSPKPKSKKTLMEPVHSDKFELFKLQYPKTHHNESLNTIVQWNMTIKKREGNPDDLIEAAKIYASICQRENRMKKHIKGTQVFLGIKEHWRDILNSGVRPDVSEVTESNVEDLNQWAVDKEAEEANETS